MAAVDTGSVARGAILKAEAAGTVADACEFRNIVDEVLPLAEDNSEELEEPNEKAKDDDDDVEFNNEYMVFAGNPLSDAVDEASEAVEELELATLLGDFGELLR